MEDGNKGRTPHYFAARIDGAPVEPGTFVTGRVTGVAGETLIVDGARMSEGRRSFWGFGRKKGADEKPAPEARSACCRPGSRGRSRARDSRTRSAGPRAGSRRTAAEKKRWFSRLTSGLSRSSSKLGDSVSGLFTKKKLDASSLQDLEDILIEADLGVETAMAITDRLSEGRFAKGIEAEELQEVLASEVEKVLAPLARPLEIGPAPFVILVVGVNGTGKTTTIGKIAAQQAAAGKRVVLAAGDTFRAAAVEQLKIWGERSGATVVSGEQGADPAGLVFDAMDKAATADLLIVDTAGRLQNKAELMAELEKIVRIIKRKNPDAPHAVLLTLDATTGQNAMNQVDIFEQERRRHRPRDDQARRHRARRHPRRDRRQARLADPLHRRRRGHRRPRPVRRARLCPRNRRPRLTGALPIRFRSATSLPRSRSAPVAQLDRALPSEGRGHRFESCRVHQPPKPQPPPHIRSTGARARAVPNSPRSSSAPAARRNVNPP